MPNDPPRLHRFVGCCPPHEDGEAAERQEQRHHDQRPVARAPLDPSTTDEEQDPRAPDDPRDRTGSSGLRPDAHAVDGKHRLHQHRRRQDDRPHDAPWPPRRARATPIRSPRWPTAQSRWPASCERTDSRARSPRSSTERCWSWPSPGGPQCPRRDGGQVASRTAQVSSCLFCDRWNSCAPGSAAKRAAASWSVAPWNFTVQMRLRTRPASSHLDTSSSNRSG